MEDVTLCDQTRLFQLAEQFEGSTPKEIIKQAFELTNNIAFACSFGAEDMVLLDMLMKTNPQVHVFYLDTDVLFPETYSLVEKAKRHYGVENLIRVSPKVTLSEQAHQHGDELWKSNPNLCCNLRKVEPLGEFLDGYDAWITGIRRDQAATRMSAKAFEWDMKFNLVKVNPLIRWTYNDVWSYVKVHEVPYNPLHDRGYPSIGCTHCTRAVQPGEDPRSGRWAGFTKTECGLHR